MSGQLLELIIFAGIAFFIINKLIAKLGSTSEEDQIRSKSLFKSSASGMRDVTNSAKNKASILKSKFSKAKKVNLKGLVVTGTEKDVIEGLADVLAKLPNFSLDTFLKGAKSAFKMIVEAGSNNGDEELEELVDKRYIDHLRSMSSSYGEYFKEKNNLTAQISEIYMFGNNIFVKVLFAGKNITNKIVDMHEEWTFTKSTLNSGSEWYLTNIDRPQ
jgi:predicted lipid-binding transport protein (Tim44 family)